MEALRNPEETEETYKSKIPLTFSEQRLISEDIPSIWHVIDEISDSGMVTFNSTFLSSIGFTSLDILEYLTSIGCKPSIVMGMVKLGVSGNEAISLAKKAAETPPRNLTERELNDILDEFPDFPAAISAESELITRKIKEFYRDQLKREKILEITIPKLRRDIRRSLIKSVIPSGAPVGIWMTDSLAYQLMQNTLDSKRSAGSSSNIEQNIYALSEILRTIKKPKFPSMTIFFKDRTVDLKYCEEFIDKYEYVQLSDIVKNIELDIKIEPNDLAKHWWVQVYAKLNKMTIPDSDEISDVLVINLQQLYMYYNGVTMQMVVDALSTLDGILVFPSPFQMGKVILVPDPNKVEENLKKEKITITSDYAGYVYLTVIIKPKLKNLAIKGIPGIDYIYIRQKSIHPLIIDEYQEGKNWILEFDQYRMAREFLKVTDISRMLAALGFKVNSNVKTLEGNKLSVTPPKNIGETPIKYILSKINTDQEAYRKREAEKQKLDPLYMEPETELMKASRVYYLETEGSNLKRVLFIPEVDYKFTVTNNFSEMIALFGIGVTRMVLMSRLGSVIGEGEKYIDPSWILLCTDMMTSRGKITGITFTGLQETQSDMFGLISSERPTESILKWAALGKPQKASGVSGKIATGRPPLVGSELVKVTVSKDLVSKMSDTGMKLDPALIQAQIRKYNVEWNKKREMTLKEGKVTEEAVTVKNFRTTETYGVLRGQPGTLVVPELLIDSSQKFISVDDLPDVMVEPGEREVPTVRRTVYLTSEMPIYNMPSPPKFSELLGIPKGVEKLLNNYM